MQTLRHRTFLRRHQAGAEGAGDAERVARRLGRQCQQIDGGRGGDERTAGTLEVVAAHEQLAGRGEPDPQADLVARCQRGNELAPVDAALPVGDRQRYRQRERAAMQMRGGVDVVHLEAVAGGRPDQHRLRDAGAKRCADDARDRVAAVLGDEVDQHARPW
jgi:hypothetical protein